MIVAFEKHIILKYIKRNSNHQIWFLKSVGTINFKTNRSTIIYSI